MSLTGEQIQELGAQGSQRAKRWLESTCRADVPWNNPKANPEKLRFRKAGAPSTSRRASDHFSFDLGGLLLGEGAAGKIFLAECKKYSSSGDQGKRYRQFLAQCYRIQILYAQFHDHFLWITWAPFLASRWGELLTAEYVQQAVTDPAHRDIALGADQYDPAVGLAVADKIIVVVLSDRQEATLSLQGRELTFVRQALLSLRETP